MERRKLSKFQLDIFRAVKKVPHGKVVSYKGIAELAGRRNSARAAGNAMARNPFPVLIPCHRVVSSDGRIGGFQSGRDLKKALLMLEGIRFDKKGRIPESFFIKKGA